MFPGILESHLTESISNKRDVSVLCHSKLPITLLIEVPLYPNCQNYVKETDQILLAGNGPGSSKGVAKKMHRYKPGGCYGLDLVCAHEGVHVKFGP